MEAIKNAIGSGSSQVQSGQEPISGQTGRGTASEPYDAGNATGKPLLGTTSNTWFGLELLKSNLSFNEAKP